MASDLDAIRKLNDHRVAALVRSRQASPFRAMLEGSVREVEALCDEVESLRRQVERLATNLGRYGRGILGCVASGCDGCIVCDPEGQVTAALQAADEERAAVVCHLRALGVREHAALFAADEIERGEHHADDE